MKKRRYWLKSDLPWRQVKTLGVFIYGVMLQNPGDMTCYVIYPETGKVMRVFCDPDGISGQQLRDENALTLREEIQLEKGIENIAKFIESTDRPCFLLDNKDLTLEVLTSGNILNMVDVYLTTDHAKFSLIQADPNKNKVNELARAIYGVRTKYEKI